jgi:predicted transcriptional regulator
MSDTERVRAWRRRLKEGGLVPMTIWVKPETKARYQDLASRQHHSGSELAQQALEAYRLDQATVAATVPDTEQLRALIRDELDQTTAIITATVTATVTEIITAALPAMLETALQRYVSDTVTETETEILQEPRWLTTAEAFVSDIDTATATDTAGGVPPQDSPAASVSDTCTDTVAETTTPSRRRGTAPSTTAADPAAATARTPRAQRRLTPLQAAEMRGKRAAGVPIKVLMEDYGISKATVQRHLKTPHAS